MSDMVLLWSVFNHILTLSCSASSWEFLKTSPFSSCFTSSCRLKRRGEGHEERWWCSFWDGGISPAEVDGADWQAAAKHVHHLHGQVQTAGGRVEANAKISWTCTQIQRSSELYLDRNNTNGFVLQMCFTVNFSHSNEEYSPSRRG